MGSLLRRRAMMHKTEEIIDTSPIVTRYGGINSAGAFVSGSNGYDVTEFYAKPSGKKITISTIIKYIDGTSQINKVAFYDENKVRLDWNTFITSTSEARVTKSPGTSTTAGSVYFRTILGRDHAEDSYAYVTNTGDIIFAGKNTPYYGKKNINW